MAGKGWPTLSKDLVQGSHRDSILFIGDYLVMHLSELVRTSFIAATASVDQLKLAGYEALQVRISNNNNIIRCAQEVSNLLLGMYIIHVHVHSPHPLISMQDVIGLFAATPDPDYPGHVLLEQYQAQVRLWTRLRVHTILCVLKHCILLFPLSPSSSSDWCGA